MDILKTLSEQAENYQKIMEERIENLKNRSEVYKEHSSVFKDFYSHAYKPIIGKSKGEKLNSKDVQETLDRIKSDIDVSHSQVGEISGDISDAYNSTQDYKTGIKNKIKYLTGLLSDINLMMDEEANSVVFKDSLSNRNFIDDDFTNSNKANIATSEGIATLSTVRDENISQHISKVTVGGDGEKGNYHIVKKVNISTASTEYDIQAKLKSEENPKDDEGAIADSNPSTWIEYQKIGIRPEDKERYILDWGSAKEIGDDLSFRINIELDKVRAINWIDISQYIPEKCNASPLIYTVRTSKDGSNFTPIYSKEAINQSINMVPQEYMEEDILNRDHNIKLSSQGVLSFSPVEAKFIEVILKQPIAYGEMVGDYYYTKTIKTGDEVVSKTIISKDMVPESILEGPPGIYRVD
jgi:hypothetical protein